MFVVFIFLVVHTTLFLKAVRSMCTVYPCVQCTVCTVYSVSCVSKAKSASLSPSYRWQLRWSHLHFLSPNTFQNTSTSKSCHITCHIAWNDFRPSQHFRHSSKSWAISLLYLCWQQVRDWNWLSFLILLKNIRSLEVMTLTRLLLHRPSQNQKSTQIE